VGGTVCRPDTTFAEAPEVAAEWREERMRERDAAC
jgi:hypothetical protein